MSKIADKVYTCLRDLFPFDPIIKEYYVYFKNTRLFFDFYIKSIGVLIEVQGEQHFKFVKQFHGTIDSFRKQKRRDNLKLEYCELNGLTLVYFYDKIDEISVDVVKSRIYEALNE